LSDELFAVAGGLGFSVVKDGRWSVSPLEVTDVLHGWSDGPRGRVLLRAGPVRLVATAQEVVAPAAECFRPAESFCGQTFALSTTGLFRLDITTPDATVSTSRHGPCFLKAHESAPAATVAPFVESGATSEPVDEAGSPSPGRSPGRPPEGSPRDPVS
jgi:hypothetical protein